MPFNMTAIQALGNSEGCLQKVTTGYVKQLFDPATGKFVSQKFTAVDEVSYENSDGESLSEMPENFEKAYLPFEMVQPETETVSLDQKLLQRWLELTGMEESDLQDEIEQLIQTEISFQEEEQGLEPDEPVSDYEGDPDYEG